METNNGLEQSVEAVMQYKKKLEEATEHTEDVKNGESTPEEEKQEPSYILYNAISDSTIEILKDPIVVSGFKSIAEKIGEDTSMKLVEIITVAMTHSAYNAIVLYDNMLRDEMGEVFKNMAYQITDIQANVDGHQGAMEVFKERISKLENKNTAMNI